MAKTKLAGRIRLDRELILDAAEAITRREGIDKLTLRRIGTELGADPTAVYRHFRDKQELLVQLADRLFGREVEIDPTLPWRERVHAMVRHGLERYRTHPELALLLAKASDDLPALLRVTETTLELLAEIGLPDDAAADWYQVIETHVVGAGVFFAVVEQRPEPRLDNLTGLRGAMALLPADEFPRTRAAAPYLFGDMDEAFDRATDAILDAIERAAAAARG
ncbi:MAG TPA: TetR family transcriptional regulator [Baekduia sp.]